MRANTLWTRRSTSLEDISASLFSRSAQRQVRGPAIHELVLDLVLWLLRSEVGVFTPGLQLLFQIIVNLRSSQCITIWPKKILHDCLTFVVRQRAVEMLLKNRGHGMWSLARVLGVNRWISSKASLSDKSSTLSSSLSWLCVSSSSSGSCTSHCDSRIEGSGIIRPLAGAVRTVREVRIREKNVNLVGTLQTTGCRS